jgi:ribosomal RNA-processing protein 9
MDFRAGRGGEDIHSDEELIDENETAAEKRVRMAKGYLAKVRQEVAGEFKVKRVVADERSRGR